MKDGMGVGYYSHDWHTNCISMCPDQFCIRGTLTPCSKAYEKEGSWKAVGTLKDFNANSCLPHSFSPSLKLLLYFSFNSKGTIKTKSKLFWVELSSFGVAARAGGFLFQAIYFNLKHILILFSPFLFSLQTVFIIVLQHTLYMYFFYLFDPIFSWLVGPDFNFKG